MVRFTFGFRATKSALILLNAPVSDAAAKMFAEPDRLETDGDAAGEAGALGVADADAVTLGVGVTVAVTVTAGVAVSVTVGVGVAEAGGDELVLTLLPLQPVAIMAMQAARARPDSPAGGRMDGTTFVLTFLPPVY